MAKIQAMVYKRLRLLRAIHHHVFDEWEGGGISGGIRIPRDTKKAERGTKIDGMYAVEKFGDCIYRGPA
jgi:hypothetical protein